jgi:hypothetical protein
VAKGQKKLSKRQMVAQKQMDEALFEIICAANLYAAAEKDFYGRKPKAPRKPTLLRIGR